MWRVRVVEPTGTQYARFHGFHTRAEAQRFADNLQTQRGFLGYGFTYLVERDL